MSVSTELSFTPPFLAGGGEIGDLMRTHDWSNSPLGAPETWPQSLRSVVGLLLNSKFPMFVAWGPQHGFLYNDPYAEILGAKHPSALGRRFYDIWSEIWSDISPLINAAMAGEATYRENLPLVLNRQGFDEQTWFTFSYSPVRDESGRVAGLFCACTETTAQILGEQRQSFQLCLEERLREVINPHQVAALASEMVGRHLGVARAGYGEIDETQALLSVEHDWTDGSVPSLAGTHRMDDFGPPIIAELKAGRTISVDDVRNDPRVGPHATAFGAIRTGSVLAVPLIKAGQFAAMLFLHHSAPHRWTEADATLVEDVAERTWAAVERARAEAALERSEQELQLLTDTLPVLIAYVDTERRYRFVNKGYETWFRRSRKDFLGRHVREVLGDAAYGEVKAKITAVLSGERLTFEQFMPYKCEQHRHTRVEYAPRVGNDGVVEGFYSLVQDITAQKQATARFEGVFNSELMGFTIFDIKTGETLAINDRFLSMTGHSRADFDEGRWDWRDFTLSEHLDKDERAVTQARERGWWEPFEKEYRRRDGTVFPVRIASAPLPGEGGRVVVSIEDITRQRAAAAALRDSESRLRFLSELDEALRAASDAPAAMQAAAAILAQRLRAARCAYADVDWDSDRFIIRSDYTAPGVASSAGTYSLDLFGPRAAADMRGGRTLVVRDVTRELAPAAGRDMFQAIGIDAIVCCPLLKDERLVAMMAVHQDRARDWKAEEVALVEAAVERCWAYVERVGAEARLRDSEERFRTLADAMPQLVWTAAPDGRVDYYNARRSEYADLKQADTRQWEWTPIVHPDDLESTREAWARSAATGEPYACEHRLAKASGRWAWHVSRATAARGPDGAILKWFGTATNIDDLKRVEAQLRELNTTLEQRVAERTAERQLLATIVDTTHEQIQALDLDYRWLAINPASAAAYGRLYGKHPKVGDNLLDLLADMPEHLAAAKAVWARALAGEAYTIACDWGHPAFGRRSYEMRFEILRDADGRQTGAFLTGRDVTDRLEEQGRLAQAEEALRQSQKMEAIGQLTGGVAHDFNNLLTPIVGSLDMLQRKGLGGEREQRLIAAAAQSAERAKTLVQRLLAFARRQPLQPIAVDIAGLVTGMGDLVASTTGPQIKVVVEAPGDLPAAKTDPNQLEMALLNLSVNARDAMPEGGTLRISASTEQIGAGHRSKLQPGPYIRLSVADTGSGMEETTLARAIEPFFSTKGIGKGTGLGLSMVHGLASQLGGALTIQSRPGLGTNVELWLPQTEARPEPSERSPDALGTKPAQGRALLVDDEELARLSTADMLADLGFAVVEAASAEEALRLVNRGERFNLVVTDHLMPGMNGTDLARAIRSLQPEVSVLLVSGYAEREDIAPDLPRLSKPFRKDELSATLAQLSRPV